ncbi:MAG: VOC family protein [Leptolyngbya sp. Prado105]|jgi:catechol 2,3-dioxygenase-like lactoylglutathione lyase family enzyme|nr:VOC family protein [Leptolyngbya sp. Prado105]
MSRVQLALNVSNVDAAVAFYAKLFKTQPAKQRPGYANFAIAEPPLKLVLIENPAAAGTMNHIGVELESSEEVSDAVPAELRFAQSAYFKQTDLPIQTENQTTCCYALQDKVWIKDTDGLPWEIYTVLSDSAIFGEAPTESSVCCG